MRTTVEVAQCFFQRRSYHPGTDSGVGAVQVECSETGAFRYAVIINSEYHWCYRSGSHVKEMIRR
jgi:hypothetical protein